MKACLRFLLGGFLIWSGAAAARADILMVPGPGVVQMKSGQWDLARLPVKLSLVSPPEWGKTLSTDTRGLLWHAPKAKGELRARIQLEGLTPRQAYILTLNGRPDLPGNALLPEAVPGLPNERYWDFLDILADDQGRYQVDVAVTLKPGPYQVRLYVKDRSDFKIVLYRDYFPFRVE